MIQGIFTNEDYPTSESSPNHLYHKLLQTLSLLDLICCVLIWKPLEQTYNVSNPNLRQQRFFVCVFVNVFAKPQTTTFLCMRIC